MRALWWHIPFLALLSCLTSHSDGELAEKELMGPPKDFLGDDGGVRGQELAKVSFFGHADTVTAMSISRDAKTAVTGSMDHTVRLWDLMKGKELACLNGHTLPVTAVAITGNEGAQVLASGSQDHSIRLWDPRLGELQEGQILVGHETTIRALTFSKDGGKLWSGGSDGEVIEWSVVGQKPLRKIQTGQKSVNHIVVDEPRRRVITAGDDHTVKIWGDGQDAPLYTLTGHEGWVLRAAISQDGNFLATSSSDQSVRLWNLQTQSLVASWPVEGESVTYLGFGKGGRILAAAIGGVDAHTIRIWDVFTGQVLRNFVGHSGGVLAGVFIGETGLMTGSDDETARIWSLPTL